MATNITGNPTASIAEMIDFPTAGLETSSTIADRCTSFVQPIAGRKADPPDAAHAIKKAAKHAAMLGAENATKLRRLYYRSSGTGMKYAGTKTRAIVDDCQDHLHIENYMTKAMWTMLASTLSFDTKLASMAEFIVDNLGVHFPKEVTYTSILGVIIAANGERMSFRAAHKHLQAFKELVIDRRRKRCHIQVSHDTRIRSPTSLQSAPVAMQHVHRRWSAR